jgi:hypothetical protein
VGAGRSDDLHAADVVDSAGDEEAELLRELEDGQGEAALESAEGAAEEPTEEVAIDVAEADPLEEAGDAEAEEEEEAEVEEAGETEVAEKTSIEGQPAVVFATAATDW